MNETSRLSDQTFKSVQHIREEGLAPLFQNVIGVALGIAALGLWVMPGSSVTPDLMLMKLGASCLFGMMGASLCVVDPKTDGFLEP